MNPIEKKALEMALSPALNNPLMVEYLMPPQCPIETYPTGQEKRRARRKQERKNKKK